MAVSLLVGIPSYGGSMKTLTWASIGNAVEHVDANYPDMFESVAYLPVNGQIVDDARTAMAEEAVRRGVDYLLMVDADVVLPEHAIATLVRDGLDVCMGYYPRGLRDDGMTNVIRLGASDYRDSIPGSELAALREKGVDTLKVKGNGLGCALVRTGVFKRIGDPWFNFVRRQQFSEDYWFCRQCTNAGIDLHVDTRVACGHIHDRVLEAR